MFRTILASHAILSDERFSNSLNKQIMMSPLSNRKNYLKRENESIDKTIFHKPNYERKIEDEVNDVMAGLIISDSKPLKKEDLCICQKVDYTVDGESKKMPLLRECIKPDIDIEFSITINESLFPWNIKEIEKAVDVFYENYMKEFVTHFQKYPKLNGRYPIVYLGGGVGYASKTCTYAAIHGKDGIRQVSKIIDQTLPMGVRKRHKHEKDVMSGASPHLLKCTVVDGELMQMGACELVNIAVLHRSK